MPRPVDSSDFERLGGDLRQEMSAMAAGLRQEMSATTVELRQEMSAATAELRQEMSAATAGLRQEMSATTAELRQEIQASAEETRLQMEQLQSRILSRVDASAAETRRYFGVVAEDLKSDIKAVAEGLGALGEKVERFRGEVREDFGRVDRRLLHLEVRVIGRSGPA
jgi:glutamate-1-semialdehyde aminotransferase